MGPELLLELTKFLCCCCISAQACAFAPLLRGSAYVSFSRMADSIWEVALSLDEGNLYC